MTRKSRSVRMSERMPLSRIRENLPYITLIGLLIAVAFMGGSSREDIRQLLLLRPLGIMALAIALICLDRRVIKQNRGTLLFALAGTAMIAVQLIPLPPSIWQALPGRELATEVARLVGEENSWRPISLIPWRTWNALYSLSLPLAALLLMCELTDAQRQRIFQIFLGIVVIGAALGFLQALSPGSGGLRFYHVYNKGVSTGLFANRNHQAAFMAAGVVAVIAYCDHFLPASMSRQVRRMMAAMAVLTLILLILATGSRMGVIALLVGLALTPLLLAREPSQNAAGLKAWLRARWLETAAVAMVAAGSLFFLFSGSLLASRVVSDTEGEELRFQIWGPIIRMIQNYFPVGTGFGTFPDVYRIVESADLVRDSYVNHAHNDWIEPLLDGGLPAALLILVALVALVRRSVTLLRLPREGWVTARTAIVIIIVMGVASITDYPLRTPLLSCLFAVATIWTITPDQLTRPRRQRWRK
jgi:hypothetical protein